VVLEVVGQQPSAHWDPTLLSSQARRLRLDAAGSHADGRMGFLVRLVVKPSFQLWISVWSVHLVVFPFVPKVAILGRPKTKDDFQSFPASLSDFIHVLVLYAVEVEVGRQRPNADTPVEATFCHVV
jgi:hypothetical protein